MTTAQLIIAALGCLLILIWLIGRRNRKRDRKFDDAFENWRVRRSERGWWKEQNPPDDGPEGDY